VITVTTTADDGPGSLRQAIVTANTSPGADDIRFRIPGGVAGDVHTIRPLSPLPEVTGPTLIDGRPLSGPQPTHPVIEIDGSAAGPMTDGLSFSSTSGPNTLRGLAINRFSRHGVVFGSPASNTLQFSYVGTDPLGQFDRGNGGSGVVILGPATIGGTRGATTEAAGNVISGNTFAGVWVNPIASGMLVSVLGNNIGTDATGSRAIGNGHEGVLAENGVLRVGEPAIGVPLSNLISGNGASGVRLGRVSSAEVYQNYIGTDATGSRAIPNGTDAFSPYHDGVTSLSANGLKVGTTSGLGNLVSGNVGAGVALYGGVATIVASNRIGTDATGNADVGNGGDGVALFSGTTAGTGGPAVQANTISGNGGDGIHVEWAIGAPANTLNVINNHIGTNAAATGALGNDGDGIDVTVMPKGSLGGVIGSATAPVGNIISANGGAGVVLNGPGFAGGTFAVAVLANRIGTDVTGNVALGNRGDGVRVSDVLAGGRVENNLVSANAGDGILIANSGTSTRSFSVGGNFVGTNATGKAPLGNGGNGIEIRASAVIGVGGDGLRFRNIISANGGHGILITGPASPEARSNIGPIVQGNYIGTDVTGAIGLGNGGSGLYIAAPGQNQIGGPTSATGNVISANRLDGITIVGFAGPLSGGSTAQNRVQGNRIGTNAAGSDAVDYLGNGGRGIAIYNSSNNMIGSSMVGAGAATEGNVIGFNGGAGVSVEGSAGAGSTPGTADGNTIVRNSIFSNGGLGIDLVNGYEGVTPNDPRDADGGPNTLQNFPLISRASATSATVTTVRYSLNSAPSRAYRIDFYASPAPDPSGFGEGKTYLGSAQVTTDSNGNANGSANLPTGVEAGSYVTATATFSGAANTSPNGGTSEFSQAVPALVPEAPSSVEGRFVFYNGSTFDRANAFPSVDDDAAIATDKRALLPGVGPATSANFTNYTRGINGVMVDVLGLPLNTIPNAADFSFRVGRAAADGSVAWSNGPAPSSVTVRRGAGANGGDRITLIWPNASTSGESPSGAVRDGWLEVTVKNGARSALAAPDVFYFGNLIGETVDASATSVRVTAVDLAAIKRALGSPRDVTNRFDLNKDGLVNAFDLTAARTNLYSKLPMLTAPAAPAEPAGPAPSGMLPILSDGAGDSVEGVWARVAT
jgi:hypothetical protein